MFRNVYLMKLGLCFTYSAIVKSPFAIERPSWNYLSLLVGSLVFGRCLASALFECFVESPTCRAFHKRSENGENAETKKQAQISPDVCYQSISIVDEVVLLLRVFSCKYFDELLLTHLSYTNYYIMQLPVEMTKLNFTSSGGYLVFDPMGLVSHSLYSILLQRLMQPVSCPICLEFIVANLSPKLWYRWNFSSVKHSCFPLSLVVCQGILHPSSW